MQISLEKAAQTLDVSPDELMFMAQNESRIQVGVDNDTMTWVFDLDHVLALKEELKEETN